MEWISRFGRLLQIVLLREFNGFHPNNSKLPSQQENVQYAVEFGRGWYYLMDNNRSCLTENAQACRESDVERREVRGMNSLGGRVGLKDGEELFDVKDDSERAGEEVFVSEKEEHVEPESDGMFVLVRSGIRRDEDTCDALGVWLFVALADGV